MSNIKFTIPYPPSVNHYWGQRGTIKYLTKKAKDFRAAIQNVIDVEFNQEPLEGRLSLNMTLYPPDRRKRDVDNPIKPTLDALEHAGVYLNDSQVYNINVTKYEFEGKNNARAEIEITQL